MQAGLREVLREQTGDASPRGRRPPEDGQEMGGRDAADLWRIWRKMMIGLLLHNAGPDDSIIFTHNLNLYVIDPFRCFNLLTLEYTTRHGKRPFKFLHYYLTGSPT